MNPQDLQQQLAPLRLPEAVSWWPLAVGWWVLLVLLCGLILFAMRLWLRNRRRKQHRRLALKRLDQLIQSEENTSAALNRLLKTLVMCEFPAEQVAALNGTAWLEFLAQHCPKVSAEELAPLAECYRPSAESLDLKLPEVTKQWIKHHEVCDV